MVLLVPVNVRIAKVMERINRDIMQIKDKRGGMLDEILQGIRECMYVCMYVCMQIKDHVG